MKAYERWQRATLRMGGQMMSAHWRVSEAMKRQFGDGLLDLALDGDSRKVENSRIPATPLTIFQSELTNGYLEIENCRQSMRDVEVYLSSFRFSGKVARSSYLRYHFEHFLHEMYMLRERIDVFLRRVARAYKRDPRGDAILAEFTALSTWVHDILKGIIDTRGTHVHTRRFEHADFDQLSMLEVFEQNITDDGDLKADWNQLYLRTFREIRKQWLTRVRENNRAIDTILDEIGSQVVAHVFAGEGDTFSPPQGVRRRESRR